MMCSKSNQMSRVVRFIALGLYLLASTNYQCSAAKAEQRQLVGDLASYMRVTPAPTTVSEETAETAAPSTPTRGATSPPNATITTQPPSTTPATNASTSQLIQSTDAPTSQLIQSTDAPTSQLIQDEEVESTSNVNVTEEEVPPAQDEVDSLYAIELGVDQSYGQVFISFSLISPLVPNTETDFEMLQAGIFGSIGDLICAEMTQGAVGEEQGPEHCVVRADILEAAAHAEESRVGDLPVQGDETTVLAFTMTEVKDESACALDGRFFEWTTWHLGWDVVQVGTTLEGFAQANHPKNNLTPDEINAKALSILQEMMSKEFEGILFGGSLEHNLNVYMEDTWIITSGIGQEIPIYSNVVPPLVISNATDTVGCTLSAEIAAQLAAAEAPSLMESNLTVNQSYGEVLLNVSIISPFVTNQKMNFKRLKDGITESIGNLICYDRTEGPDALCSVRPNILGNGTLLATANETTILAFTMTNVNDGAACSFDGRFFEWTTWHLGWDLVQVGATLQGYVLGNHSSESLTPAEINDKAVVILQEMMSKEFHEGLLGGVLEHKLNVFMEDTWVLPTGVGTEVDKYNQLVPPSIVSDATDTIGCINQAPEVESNLLFIITFGGAGGIAVVVALLYFACQPTAQHKSHKKRLIVVLDDTSKSSADSPVTAASPVNVSRNVNVSQIRNVHVQQPRNVSVPPRAPSQNLPAENNNVAVAFDAKLLNDQREEHKEVHVQEGAQWEGHSSVGDGDVGDALEMHNSIAVDVDAMEAIDIENQNAEATRRSISASLDRSLHSDNHSMGSMSIDLADWA